ncbi:MAG TPA: NAD(P)/FAD-dependent oxidoreductase [Sporichthya sp.]|nr:NAD(P)/FAD-dependent oxidoreductase [Sporichthya sp.]
MSSSAVVVGAGPNGLAAAAVLAKAGVDVTVLEAHAEIGGGTRTSEAIVPGLLHDQCSAVHTIAVGSPVLRQLDLESHGLSWRWPEIDCAHPLDGGDAALLHRSVATTADGLGADGRRWRALFERTSAGYGALAPDILGPLVRVPSHPIRLARFGVPTTLPAGVLARGFRTEAARALWGGVAAHAIRPLNRPFTSAIGLGILTAGHHDGWPVAAGGSRKITDALAAVVRAHGGSIECDRHIRRAEELPAADVVLFDLAPVLVAEILGDRLPARVARAYRRFQHGPGAFKVDYAVDGGVPWTNEAVGRAGTVHLGGTFAEIAANEREVHRGRMPERPFVLVAQQYVADKDRSVGDIHPLWTYAHVPAGYTGDATEAITAQIERFAPGFRERIIGLTVRSPAEFAQYNPNYIGGDIVTGAKSTPQLLFGPRLSAQPYDTGVPGMYLCSAATPPGVGVHGMCGYHAAGAVLRDDRDA